MRPASAATPDSPSSVPGTATSEGAETAARWRSVWLFRPWVDLSILLLPLGVVGVAWAWTRGDSMTAPREQAAWLSQFVLGNTTHVILTFLLLGTRREVLHATRGQAALVIIGSLLTLGVTFGLFWSLEHRWPTFEGLGLAAALVFAQHHALAQVKGFWSLYNLRGSALGLKPAEGERTVMQNFVAIALLFTLIRTLFVGRLPYESSRPFINALPGEPALLGYGASYPMLLAWLLYSAWVLRTLLATGTRNLPKVLYVGIHLLVVAVTMLAPAWGAVLAAGIHGLEYYAISARMLWPRADESGWLRGALVVPAMLLAMAPIFVVGLLRAPLASGWTGAPLASVLGLDAHVGTTVALVNAVVMAHYFADAFIYRFRIPEVRRVALARLGF